MISTEGPAGTEGQKTAPEGAQVSDCPYILKAKLVVVGLGGAGNGQAQFSSFSYNFWEKMTQ